MFIYLFFLAKSTETAKESNSGAEPRGRADFDGNARSVQAKQTLLKRVPCGPPVRSKGLSRGPGCVRDTVRSSSTRPAPRWVLVS